MRTDFSYNLYKASRFSKNSVVTHSNLCVCCTSDACCDSSIFNTRIDRTFNSSFVYFTFRTSSKNLPLTCSTKHINLMYSSSCFADKSYRNIIIKDCINSLAIGTYLICFPYFQEAFFWMIKKISINYFEDK